MGQGKEFEGQKGLQPGQAEKMGQNRANSNPLERLAQDVGLSTTDETSRSLAVRTILLSDHVDYLTQLRLDAAIERHSPNPSYHTAFYVAEIMRYVAMDLNPAVKAMNPDADASSLDDKGQRLLNDISTRVSNCNNTPGSVMDDNQVEKTLKMYRDLSTIDPTLGGAFLKLISHQRGKDHDFPNTPSRVEYAIAQELLSNAELAQRRIDQAPEDRQGLSPQEIGALQQADKIVSYTGIAQEIVDTVSRLGRATDYSTRYKDRIISEHLRESDLASWVASAHNNPGNIDSHFDPISNFYGGDIARLYRLEALEDRHVRQLLEMRTKTAEALTRAVAGHTETSNGFRQKAAMQILSYMALPYMNNENMSRLLVEIVGGIIQTGDHKLAMTIMTEIDTLGNSARHKDYYNTALASLFEKLLENGAITVDAFPPISNLLPSSSESPMALPSSDAHVVDADQSLQDRK